MKRGQHHDGSLQGKTAVITGASRGIGRAIAVRFGRDGANVVIAAKSNAPHHTLSGTIHSVAAEVRAAGGVALPVTVDVRDEDQIRHAVDGAVHEFGGIDILVNNASALALTGLRNTSMSRYDLLMQVNAGGTYACSHHCVQHLVASRNPHILTIAPPAGMALHWFGRHLPHAISKYAMTMCAIGIAEEFRADGIGSNTLWPRTLIATDAVRVYFPSEVNHARHPAIMADAAYAIVTQNSRTVTGQCFYDEDVLRAIGQTDFSGYAVYPESELTADIYVD